MEQPRGSGFWKLLVIALPLILTALIPLVPIALKEHTAPLESQTAAEEGRWGDAADALRSLLQFEPWRVDLLEPIASFEVKAKAFAQAREDYRKALEAGSLSGEGRLSYAGLLFQAGEKDAALQLLKDTSQISDLSSEQYAQILGLQRQYQDDPGAKVTAAAWAKAKPMDGKALYAQGIALINESPTRAALYLQDSARLEPSLYQKATKIIQAVADQSSTSDAAYGWLLLGQTLASVKEWQAAQGAFSRSVQLNPEYAEAWALQSEALQQSGRDGKTALDKALALNPNSNIVRAVAASYWRRKGQPEIALAILKEAAANQPENLIWQFEMGATLAEMGDTALAFTYYQKAAQLQPDSATAWQQLAEFCIQYGIDVGTTGLNAARRALSLAPENAQILDLVGWMLLANGDTYTAERFLQQALAKDEWNPQSHLHLAQVFLQTERLKEAEDHLRRAIELDADGSVRMQAERLLARYFGGN